MATPGSKSAGFGRLGPQGDSVQERSGEREDVRSPVYQSRDGDFVGGQAVAEIGQRSGAATLHCEPARPAQPGRSAPDATFII